MRSLIAVADNGAITHAASRLGLTQPALSRRIQQLEDEFGAPLLVRGRTGAQLTAIGRLVDAEARVLVNRYDQLRAEVTANLNLQVGTVRIGGGATAIEFLVPPAIAELQREYSSLRFQVKEAGSREIEQDVVSGALELGIVTRPVAYTDELKEELLFTDHVVLVAHEDHPLRQSAPLKLIQLAEQNLVGFEGGSAIRSIVDAALRRAQVEMNVVMELRSIPAILRMVATTGHLAFVSRLGLQLQSHVVEIPVPGLSIRRELALISRRGDTLSPASATFADQLIRTVAKAGT